MASKKGFKREKDIYEAREKEKKWQTERETKIEGTKINDDACEQQKRIKKDIKKKKQKYDTKKGDRMGGCISMLRQCYFISIVSGSSSYQDNNIMKKKS